MRQCDCFWMIIMYDFAVNASAGLILMIGFDRLLAISAPMRYKMWTKWKYYLVMISVPTAYSCSCLVAGVICASCDERVPGVCLPPRAFRAWSQYYWIGTNAVICTVTILVYALTMHRAVKLGARFYLKD